ncbi:MAG TPA: metalloregulator ArsR/SmtB family transcription factor [Acidimicrobiales bacterium]|nr:metalloregulator ArsR/SmtB family transcription factor [Acidimicrobiales bacterium]
MADPDEVFEALADATRRQIMRRLSDQGPLSATDLAGQFPVSRQAVVKHLSTLAHAGLLHRERQGREVLYGLVPGRLNDATTWLDEVGRTWDRRLAALVGHFSPDPQRPGPDQEGP